MEEADVKVRTWAGGGRMATSRHPASETELETQTRGGTLRCTCRASDLILNTEKIGKENRVSKTKTKTN